MIAFPCASCCSLRRALSRFATMLLLSLSSLSSAEDFLNQPLDLPEASAAAPASAQMPVTSMIVSTGLSLALVIALALGCAWAYRRLGRRGLLPGGRGRHLRLVEVLPLGMKRSAALVQIGDRVLVVGLHEQGMSALADLPDLVLRPVDTGAAKTGNNAVTEPSSQVPVGDPARSFKERLASLTGRVL